MRTSGRETRTLRGHAAGVFGVTFSPDGGRIASISWDGTVKLWEVVTGGEVRTFRAAVLRPKVSVLRECRGVPSRRPVARGRWL